MSFVIVFAPPRCLAVGEGKAGRNENPGMHCELGVIRDRLQGDRELWEQKLLPVVLPGESVSNIPGFPPATSDGPLRGRRASQDALGNLLAAIHNGIEDDSRSPVVRTATSTSPPLADS